MKDKCIPFVAGSIGLLMLSSPGLSGDSEATPIWEQRDGNRVRWEGMAGTAPTGERLIYGVIDRGSVEIARLKDDERVDWRKTLSLPRASEAKGRLSSRVVSAAEADDGGYCIAVGIYGVTSPQKKGSMVLYKIAKTGVIEWVQQDGSDNLEVRYRFDRESPVVAGTPDGGCMLVSSVLGDELSNEEMMVVLFNRDRAVKRKLYAEVKGLRYSVAATEFGYVVAASTGTEKDKTSLSRMLTGEWRGLGEESELTFVSLDWPDLKVTKLRKAGKGKRVYDLASAVDGRVLLVGWLFGNDDSQIERNDTKAWVAALDKNLRIQWEKTFPSAHHMSRFERIVLTSAGQYAAIGFLENTLGVMGIDDGGRIVWKGEIDELLSVVGVLPVCYRKELQIIGIGKRRLDQKFYRVRNENISPPSCSH